MRSGCFFLYVFVLELAYGKVGFIKDQDMEVQFPPPVARTKDFPDGHLRPLGWQRAPDAPVEELDGLPHTRVFYNGYAKTRTPVVFRQGLKDTPVMKKWENDDYLKNNFGKLNVSVIMERPIFHKGEMKRTPTIMKLKKFLLEYMYETWYLTSIIAPELQQELPLPKILACGTLSRFLQVPELWMSSGGTSSTLHSHSDHNLHCVLFGKRNFIVIKKEYKDNFDFEETFPSSGEGHSSLNMDMINAYKYNRIKETPWTYSSLLPGDCILIPAGYLHQVRAYGRSISFTILLTPVPEIDDEGCKKKDEDTYRSLADASFTWSFVGGQKQLTNWKLNPESMRHHLIALVREEKALRFEVFKKFYEDAMQISSSHPSAEEVFNILKSQFIQEEEEDDNYIGDEEVTMLNRREKPEKPDSKLLTRFEISEISDDNLQTVADILNSAHGTLKRRRDEL